MGRTLIALAVVLGMAFGMVACKEKTATEQLGDAAKDAEKDAGKAADDVKKAADDVAK